MFNEDPEVKSFSVLKVMLGFALGLLLSLGFFFAALFVGPAAGRKMWMVPVLNGIALATACIVSLRSSDESGLARGALLAFSVVFCLNAICGVSFLRL